MKKILLVLILTILLTSCEVEEIRNYRKVKPITEVQVTKPTLIHNVYANDKNGICFPIGENLAVTAYHVVVGGNPLSVENYSAELIYEDSLKDIAVLKTVHSFDMFYTLADKDKVPLIGSHYEKGDSGMPLLNKSGEVVSILIGQKSTGEWATVDITFLVNLEELINGEDKSGKETEEEEGEVEDKPVDGTSSTPKQIQPPPKPPEQPAVVLPSDGYTRREH